MCLKKIECFGSDRYFQYWWTSKYVIILRNNKALCVSCSESIICRTLSVKRHFETVHKTLLTKSTDEKKSYTARASCNTNLQSNTLVKSVKSLSSLISVSFDVAKSITVGGEPLNDGDFIKTVW